MNIKSEGESCQYMDSVSEDVYNLNDAILVYTQPAQASNHTAWGRIMLTHRCHNIVINRGGGGLNQHGYDVSWVY